MSITSISNVGYIVKLPENDMFIEDIFTNEMTNIDPNAIIEFIGTSPDSSSFMVVSKLINKTSIEKCINMFPVLSKQKELKIKINRQKEKKESAKLLKKLKKLPSCRKFSRLVNAINDIVTEAKEYYKEGDYRAVHGDLFDYEYLLTIYKLLKAGFLAETHKLIEKNLVLYTDLNYFPLPEKTLKAIEAAYMKKYKSDLSNKENTNAI
jgi:hypothetical protein